MSSPENTPVWDFDDYHQRMCRFEVMVRRFESNLEGIGPTHPALQELNDLVQWLKSQPLERMREYLHRRHALFVRDHVASGSEAMNPRDPLGAVAGLRARRERRYRAEMKHVHFTRMLEEKDEAETFMKVINESRRGLLCLYYGLLPPEIKKQYFWEEPGGVFSKVEIKWCREIEPRLFECGVALL